MLIAILDFDTAPADRPAALAQLLAEAPRIRAMPGNLAFRAYADPQRQDRLTVVHEWEDRDSFAGYLASSAFARSGEVLRPLMVAPPVSRRFEARLLDTVN